MKKLGLIMLISLFVMTAKASAVFIGCVHGRYFIAKYDDNGNLLSYGFGLGCVGSWVLPVRMIMTPMTPTGVEFDHSTEERINAMPVECFNKPFTGDTNAMQINEQVKTDEGSSVYVYANALNPDIRKFLFEF